MSDDYNRLTVKGGQSDYVDRVFALPPAVDAEDFEVLMKVLLKGLHANPYSIVPSKSDAIGTREHSPGCPDRLKVSDLDSL